MGEWGSMALAGMAHGCAALPRSPLRPELRPARAASRPGWAGEANPRRASPLCIRVQSPSTLLDGRNGGVWHFRAIRELTGCVMARFVQGRRLLERRRWLRRRCPSRSHPGRPRPRRRATRSWPTCTSAGRSGAKCVVWGGVGACEGGILSACGPPAPTS